MASSVCPVGDDQIAQQYSKLENGRRYRLVTPTAKKPGGDTSYEFHGVRPPRGRFWAYTKDKLEAMFTEGLLYFSSSGQPYIKYYLDERPGVAVQSIWTDVPPMSPTSKERLGYATQKPEALLNRVIAASSSEGELVLDPFCGCGTATVAAQRLGRQWIGIDITWLAVDLMQRRLADTFPDAFPKGASSIPVDGEPHDSAAVFALAERDKFQFQFWAVAKLGGTARGGQNRKGMDRGIDGIVTFPERNPNDPDSTALEYKQVVISVKGGHTGPTDVRDLGGTMKREKAPIGVLVTVNDPTPEMRREAAAAGLYTSPWTGKSYPALQILTAAAIVHGGEIDMPPQRSHTDFSRAPLARTSRDQGRLLL